ncbi:MAG: hypothetical protein U0838_15675 [Chloroflexota bacterium]
MDTFTPPELTDPERVPTRVVRGEGPSRLRVIATSFAVAGLTATGGLAVILSTAATSGADTAATVDGGAQQGPQASGVPLDGTTPDATAAPNQPQNGTTTQPGQGGRGGFSGGQPPQFGQGAGPGHAASGGS